MREGPSAISNAYKKFYKLSERKKVVSKKKFIGFLERVNKEIVKKILDGKQVSLPFRIGVLRIEKKRINFKHKTHLRIDYGYFKKTGKKIFHLNDGRDGYYYRIRWIKGSLGNTQPYVFKPCRTFSRTLSKNLKENINLDYFEYDA